MYHFFCMFVSHFDLEKNHRKVGDLVFFPTVKNCHQDQHVNVISIEKGVVAEGVVVNNTWDQHPQTQGS